MTEDELSRMPWTHELMTDDEFREWLKSREATGAMIDIENCEIGSWHTLTLAPYFANSDVPNPPPDIETNVYVRSAESRGWVWEGDLPPEKYKALTERIGPVGDKDPETGANDGDIGDVPPWDDDLEAIRDAPCEPDESRQRHPR